MFLCSKRFKKSETGGLDEGKNGVSPYSLCVSRLDFFWKIGEVFFIGIGTAAVLREDDVGKDLVISLCNIYTIMY